MFTLESKDLEKSLSKAIDVVGMGSKTTAATVTLNFKKTGVTLGVSNQAGAYTSDLVCKVADFKKSPPVAVVPDVLLAYIKGRKQIKVEPKPDGLAVIGSGGLNSKLYYVGDGVAVDMPEIPEGTEGMHIHAIGMDLLKSIEPMRDRTEKKPLSGRLVWNKKASTIEIVAGDTHHATHIHRANAKCKANGDITLPFASLKRVLNVGGQVYNVSNTVYAISETESITLNDMVESEAISMEDLKGLYDTKAKSSSTVKTSDMSSALDTLIIGTEDATSVTLQLDPEAGVLSMSVKTGAAKGAIKLKTAKAKNKMNVKILAVHLLDCLKCIKSKEVKIDLRNNVIYLEGVAGDDTVRCVIALVPE